MAGNIYTRIMNPPQDVLEKRVAALEGANFPNAAGLAVASGMAAITYAIQTIAEAGDNIVSASTLYGGSYNLFAHTLPQFGIEVRFADNREPESFEKLIDDRTKAIICESVGNPLGNVPDFERLAEIAHRHGIPLIVDNTVPTPCLLRSFEHGADIVVHALTKYLGGHGNSIGGIIVDSGTFPWAEHKQKFRRLNEPDVSYHGVVYTEALGPAAYTGRARVVSLRNMGAAISPFNAFLILQGIETLALRMDRICDNTLKVAEFLEGHARVSWVNYAGLPEHRDRALVDKYMGGRASGILNFGVKGGLAGGAGLHPLDRDLRLKRTDLGNQAVAQGVQFAETRQGQIAPSLGAEPGEFLAQVVRRFVSGTHGLESGETAIGLHPRPRIPLAETAGVAVQRRRRLRLRVGGEPRADLPHPGPMVQFDQEQGHVLAGEVGRREGPVAIRHEARQPAGDLVAGHGVRDGVALADVATQVQQQHADLDGLDALGHQIAIERPGQADNAIHDGQVLGVAEHRLDEHLVDLERVHRQAAEIGERRVAGAEIVEGDADAGFPAAPEYRHDRVHVVDRGGFQDLDFERAGLQFRARRQQRGQFLDEVRRQQVAGGDVEAQRLGQSLGAPGGQLAQALGEDPAAHGDVEFGVRDRGEELGRTQQALFGTGPADQAFEGEHLAVPHIDDRLVMEAELAVRQRQGKPLVGGAALPRPLVLRGVE